jgi:PAS domain-containing protein
MFSKYESFAVLSGEGTVLYCSPPLARLLDAGEPLVGTSIDALLKPAGSDHADSWYCRKDAAEGVLLYGSKAIRLLYKTEPVYMDQRFVGTLLFVTEGSLSQAKTLEELYAHAFQLNPGLSAITVVETGEHLDVNEAWLRAMGYHRSEVIGKTSTELNIWETECPKGNRPQAASVGKGGDLEARMRRKTEASDI